MVLPEPPIGYLRVLVERPRDDALIDAARALLAGENPVSFILRYIEEKQPQGLLLDPSFGALPIGPGATALEGQSAEVFILERSAKYLVRGFLRADNLSDIPERIDNELVHSDPMIGEYLTCGSTRAVGDTITVKQRLDTAKLAAHGLDGAGVAIAIVDSGIYLPHVTRTLGFRPSSDPANSWKLNVVTNPFQHRLGHGTMCAFDALISAPKATLLDMAMLIARAPGDHSVRGTVGAAMQAYLHLMDRWVIGPSKGRPKPYKSLVVSNSWGIYHPSLEDFPPTHPGRFIDNPHHILRTYVRQLAREGVDIVFAGNNCGKDCPSPTCLGRSSRMIMGANAYPEVLTLGGCDTNDDRVGYSSVGPSIQNMYAQKPDITAYTHFIGSKTIRSFVPDTGVSTACPVAAGCVAALRTRLPPSDKTPNQLFDTLRMTARAGNGGGPGGAWNPEYGYGIIDPVAAGRALWLIP